MDLDYPLHLHIASRSSNEKQVRAASFVASKLEWMWQWLALSQCLALSRAMTVRNVRGFGRSQKGTV